ncbi:MAG: hypothetical protein ACKO3T_05110 [Planctomycetaceae bacterium]
MDDTGDTSSLDDELARKLLLQLVCQLRFDRRLKEAELLLKRNPHLLPDYMLWIQQDLTTATEHADAALQELNENKPDLAAFHLNNSQEISCDLVWNDPHLQPLQGLLTSAVQSEKTRIPSPVLLVLAMSSVALLVWSISRFWQPTVEQSFASLTAAADACNATLAHRHLAEIQSQAISSRHLCQRLVAHGRQRAQQAFELQRSTQKSAASLELRLRQAELCFDLAVTAGDFVQHLERGIVRTELGLLLRQQNPQPAEAAQMLRLAVQDFQKLLQDSRISSPDLPPDSLWLQVRDASRSRLLRLQRIAPESFTR